MEEIYPIGSIIEIDEIKMIILGYKMIDINNIFLNCYIAAVYPVGFTTEEDLMYVSINDVKKCISIGFINNIAKEYLVNKKKLYNMTKTVLPEQSQQWIEELNKYLKREG